MTMRRFDPTDPNFLQNPYPVYDQMRAESPIFFHQDTNLWYVTTHRDVSTILRDRRFGRDVHLALPPEQCPVSPPEYEPFTKLGASSLFDKEPPEHTRLRSLVQMAFTPRRIQQMRPHIQLIAAELLDKVAPAGQMDVLADFAEPLPVAVISQMLGIPQSDRHALRPWSNAIVTMYELNHTPEQADKAIEAASEFADYLRYLAAQRRADPLDDLITALALAEADGDR
ncbi:MAG: cytochrome P450, partial [Chloroflexota bacterium]